jgi:uncharacterized protein with FMN-binding domain
VSHPHKPTKHRKPDPPASGGKLKLSLTALSSAAVLAIYGAGFMRTRAAAERFAADESIPNRPSGPVVPGAPIARSGGPGPALTPAPPAPVTMAPEPATASTPSIPRPVETATTPTPASAPAASAVPAPKAVSTDAKAEPLVASNDVTGGASAAPPAALPVVPAPVATPAPTTPAPAAAPTATAPLAPPAVSAPPAPAVPPKPVYKDGSYLGWGTSRHGDIEAKVTIVDGKIQSAVINQCWTQYSCSWIAPLPPQVAQRQSAEVDYVSGGTQSTYAFYYAVIEALKKAK